MRRLLSGLDLALVVSFLLSWLLYPTSDPPHVLEGPVAKVANCQVCEVTVGPLDMFGGGYYSFRTDRATGVTVDGAKRHYRSLKEGDRVKVWFPPGGGVTASRVEATRR